MAESALAARTKACPPCTLKHRVQREYNSLLVNALNRICKSNLSLNNFKWLLTKLELSCVRNIIPRSRKRLRNGYPVLNQEFQNHDPVGRHIPRIRNVLEYPLPRGEIPNLADKIWKIGKFNILPATFGKFKILPARLGKFSILPARSGKFKILQLTTR